MCFAASISDLLVLAWVAIVCREQRFTDRTESDFLHSRCVLC